MGPIFRAYAGGEREDIPFILIFSAHPPLEVPFVSIFRLGTIQKFIAQKVRKRDRSSIQISRNVRDLARDQR